MYQFTNTNTIRRLSDGATIPADPANADYRAYLAWAAIEGNEAAPYVPPARDLEAEQLALLDSYTRVDNRNFTPGGAIRMNQWVAAGNEKAAANAAWLESHWAEFYVKRDALAAGGTPDITPSSLWKPHSFGVIAAEMAALSEGGGEE